MNKFILSTLILSALTISTSAVLANQAVNTKKTPTQQSFSWASITEVLFNTKKPPVEPRKGGSRGDICMISPDKPNNNRIVWSDRPLFLWQGRVQKIALRTQGSNKDIWSQAVTTETQNITYTGQPLQPGEGYAWVVNSSMFIPFQVMEAQQRDRISADLQTLENQLKAKGENTEAIALAKANYFAKNQLWSDVLQQIYSVPKPELNQIRQEISNKLCSTQSLQGDNSTTH